MPVEKCSHCHRRVTRADVAAQHQPSAIVHSFLDTLRSRTLKAGQAEPTINTPTRFSASLCSLRLIHIGLSHPSRSRGESHLRGACILTAIRAPREERFMLRPNLKCHAKAVHSSAYVLLQGSLRRLRNGGGLADGRPRARLDMSR